MGAVINPFTGKIDITGAGSAGTVTKVSVTTANGVSGTVATDTTTPAISLSLGAITPTTVNAVTISGTSTPTLAVTGTTTVSGTNSGDGATNSSSMYIGTTSHALNRASAAETLAGITLTTPEIGAATGTSVDLGATTLYGSRAITVDTGGVLNVDIGSAAGDDFTVDTNKLVVEGDTGNVGIGTTSPKTKLALPLNSAISFEASAGVTDIAITHTADTLTFTGGTVALGTATATGGLTGNVTGNLTGKADTAGVADSATGNAGTVTNGVYTTGNQSIAGIKTLSDATEASNVTTAGTIVSGGLAVAKRVYATDMTVTNPIVGSLAKRVTTANDANSITPNSDTADITYQANTQAAGNLTINADGGSPVVGRSWLLKIKSTNVQTFVWNAQYVGGTYALPISTIAGKIDYFAFIYCSVNSKWQYTGGATGF